MQGAGKTTTAGKLARWLIEKQNKKVLMVSTDVYRPAAILQLQTLAAQVGAGFAGGNASEAPVAIAKRALTEATLQAYDVLLLDTAGRLHIDAEMMAEVQRTGSGHQAARAPVRRRQHGGTGRGQRRQGIQRRARA